MASYGTRSPPPLQHPVPTHPAYIPEPPSTPASPPGYQRYTSSPQPPLHNAIPANPPYTHPIPQTGAFTSPFQHSQQQHRQPQPIPPHSDMPDFAAWGMNDATAQFGMQIGQSAVAAGQEYVQKNFSGIIPLSHLKHHFNVSNLYVIKKLNLVLFPWLHKPWTRKMRRAEQGQGVEWQPPRDDINSPDLYIPLMALVTYILLAALQTGLQGRFHPQVLGQTASTALAVLVLDFFFVKTGCYFLNVQGNGQVVDLIAYGGYKFVGVILTITAGFLPIGRALYWVVFIYAFLANALFLLRSLRSVVLPDATHTPANVGTVNPAQRRRRITFLFLEAVFQVVYMAILVRV